MRLVYGTLYSTDDEYDMILLKVIDGLWYSVHVHVLYFPAMSSLDQSVLSCLDLGGSSDGHA